MYYKNILEILISKVKDNPQKVVFEDRKRAVTYQEFLDNAIAIGSCISERLGGIKCQPIAVYAERSVEAIELMFGVLFSGNYYTVLDIESPIERINRILEKLEPRLIVSNTKNINIGNNIGTLFLDDILIKQYNNEINKIDILETDPIYVLFTSGSTGVPKGAVIAHKSVVAYSYSIKNTFKLNEDSILGNQTPFYFSMSVLDIFVTIISGGSMYIIPKSIFAFPKKIISLLNEKKINTIYWVPSAMNIITRFKAFTKEQPQYLKLVMFAGETMPSKCIRYWQQMLEGVVYANLFGPTEITDTCTYHILERVYSDDESIPIGKAFENCEVFILDKNNKVVNNQGEEGELIVRGPFVGLGYLNDEEQTRKVFVQNPLNNYYYDVIYRTGDRVCYNENKEIMFIGRMDYQIKHMGYRIELGEIEKGIMKIREVENTACFYNKENQSIIAYVETKINEEEILRDLKKILPKYMVPQKVICIDKMPLNANGKIDRVKLSKE